MVKLKLNLITKYITSQYIKHNKGKNLAKFITKHNNNEMNNHIIYIFIYFISYIIYNFFFFVIFYL